MHGSLGRDNTFNNMAAIGPDFKRGFVDSCGGVSPLAEGATRQSTRISDGRGSSLLRRCLLRWQSGQAGGGIRFPCLRTWMHKLKRVSRSLPIDERGKTRYS
jgi:hypothetical protein